MAQNGWLRTRGDTLRPVQTADGHTPGTRTRRRRSGSSTRSQDWMSWKHHCKLGRFKCFSDLDQSELLPAYERAEFEPCTTLPCHDLLFYPCDSAGQTRTHVLTAKEISIDSPVIRKIQSESSVVIMRCSAPRSVVGFQMLASIVQLQIPAPSYSDHNPSNPNDTLPIKRDQILSCFPLFSQIRQYLIRPPTNQSLQSSQVLHTSILLLLINYVSPTRT